ncbi:hypothetical protein K469DRAFT_490729, partial [Zopfia rhizophila CBS 207.26]
WRWCKSVVTSPLSCISTDDMSQVFSVAIDLGLCCRFYSDEKCSVGLNSWGGDGAWYPGTFGVNDQFRTSVGSYQC